MRRIRLYGCLAGPRAVKDVDTGEPVGGVIQRIDITILPGELPEAVLIDIYGNRTSALIAEIDLQPDA
jgi:hypothetical protein